MVGSCVIWGARGNAFKQQYKIKSWRNHSMNDIYFQYSPKLIFFNCIQIISYTKYTNDDKVG